jgi:hypothetical protein
VADFYHTVHFDFFIVVQRKRVLITATLQVKKEVSNDLHTKTNDARELAEAK